MALEAIATALEMGRCSRARSTMRFGVERHTGTWIQKSFAARRSWQRTGDARPRR